MASIGYLFTFSIFGFNYLFSPIVLVYFLDKAFTKKERITQRNIIVIVASILFVVMQVAYGPIRGFLLCEGLCGINRYQDTLATESLLIDKIDSKDRVDSGECLAKCLTVLTSKNIKFVEVRYVKYKDFKDYIKTKSKAKLLYKRYELVDPTQASCNKTRYHESPYYAGYRINGEFMKYCISELDIKEPTSNYLLTVKRHDDKLIPFPFNITFRSGFLDEQRISYLGTQKTVALSREYRFHSNGNYGTLVTPFAINDEVMFHRPSIWLNLPLESILNR